jgi:hypothetical protein
MGSIVSYTDNMDEVLASFKEASKSFTVRLRNQNVLEYAHALHDREAYYVFNTDELEKIIESQFEELSGAKTLITKDLVEKIAEAIGWRYVNFLRSVVANTRPAISSREGIRFAHPGGWADRTGNLAAGFRFKVGSSGFKAGESLPEPDKAKVLG